MKSKISRILSRSEKVSKRPLIILCIIGLFIMVGLTSVAYGRAAIKDVEYLKGEDFVQLRFITDKIISIPDVFYPEEGNIQRLVMRIGEVDFKSNKKNFRFNSPIIDSVEFRKNTDYSDIEIRLKERVNYRVFTNRNGLYIEFPNIKIAGTASSSAPVSTTGSKSTFTSTSVASSVSAALANNQKPQAQPRTEPVGSKSVPPSSSAVTSSTPSTTFKSAASSQDPVTRTAQDGNWNSIRDIKISEKSNDKVKIEFVMSRATDYNVIPVFEKPVRLAIDLENTRCSALRKPVDHMNVKLIRGASNTPSVFRIVFDLHYLKSYSVSLNKNVLEVEFYNLASLSKNKINNKNLLSQPEPGLELASNPGSVANEKADEAADKSPGIQDAKEITNESLDALDNDPEPGLDEKDGNGNGNGNENGSITNTGSAANGNNGSGETSSSAVLLEELSPRTILTAKENKNEEFFSEEKAVVSSEESTQDTSSTSTGENTAESTETDSLSKLFQNRTINEGKKEWAGELRSYHLKNQDLQNLLIHFARDTGISMVFDPDISGTVTAELNNVPWDQALEIFLTQNGLGMERDGNVIRIAKIDKLEREAEQRRKLRESRQKEVDLATRTRALNYASANEVKSILDKSLTSRGNILVDARSNTLIISEVPENFPILDGLIETLDTATPQVSIAAKMIETNSNYTKNLGIQWGFGLMADAAYGNQTTLKFPNSVGVYGNTLGTEFLGPLGGYAVNFPAAGANSGVSFSLGNVSNTFRLDVALSAMQRKGKGRIIQSPRFVTQNNVQARISQGYKIPIQTIQNNTITVQYMDATLELIVTPTITADDTITMQIDIKNDNVDWGNVVDERPSLLTQAAKTTVKAKNGETIVIGGMYKVETGTSRESIPLLHKLPIIGNLFKNSNRSTQQRETLIFITPRIIR